MNCPPTFIDLHCHLLPGLDDGPAAAEQSLAMAELAVAEGIETIVATPHQLGNHAGNSAAAIRSAARQFQELLEQRGLPLRVLPGADVRIEPDLREKIRRDEVLTLADRRRHVLLELPHEIYIPLEPMLAELAAAGLTGILSHPERNRGIMSRPEVLRPLIERGCLMQITAESLIGGFGARVGKFAETLVRQGLVHFLATDAHDAVVRPPRMRQAFQRIVELAGERAAVDLCQENPKAVIEGRTIAVRKTPMEKTSRFGWFSRTKASGLLTR
jgi:protein-tyrosine phosphatase